MHACAHVHTYVQMCSCADCLVHLCACVSMNVVVLTEHVRQPIRTSVFDVYLLYVFVHGLLYTSTYTSGCVCILDVPPQTLPHLKRQASVPNFKYSSHHPTPSAATPADGAVKLSSRSLARTSSAVSVGGVESAQSGYLASDGSSLTLDGTEQDSASSQVTLGSDEWNDHANSLVVPTSPPIENGFLDSVFERHIQQYSNASSASSVNQLTHPHPLSPPIHTRESGRNYSNHQYYAFKRQPSAPKQLVASSFNYPPHLSPATSNEGVDV